MTDDERRRRDREAARARRKTRREAILSAQNERATTGATGGSVAYLSPNSSLLDAHIRRVERFLDLLEYDPSISTAEKLRVFVAALPALAKGIEAVEFRGRLEALEARILAHSRWDHQR